MNGRTILLTTGTTIILAALSCGVLGVYTHQWLAAFACFVSAVSIVPGVVMVAKEPA